MHFPNDYDDFEPIETRERLIEAEQFGGDVTFTDGTTGTINPDGILCPDEAGVAERYDSKCTSCGQVNPLSPGDANFDVFCAKCGGEFWVPFTNKHRTLLECAFCGERSFLISETDESEGFCSAEGKLYKVIDCRPERLNNGSLAEPFSHNNTPPGFKPCTRESAHEGPCALEEVSA